jgi:serine/threonine protein phosphatase 1
MTEQAKHGEEMMAARRFAVGDVHGCLKTLRKLVEDIIQLERRDTLILLGDYIDRGPDSKGVLDYLLHLMEARYCIKPLLGNHEEMLLNAVAGGGTERRLWTGNGGLGTLEQFGVLYPQNIPQLYIDFLSSLPSILVDDQHVFVHAGLDFRTADPIHDTSPHDLLWIRDIRPDRAKINGKTLVCGHSQTMLFEILNSLSNPVIYLDNGCFSKRELGFGSLVALNLESRELVVVVNCE